MLTFCLCVSLCLIIAFECRVRCLYSNVFICLLSVCYLFVSLVSSPVAWRLAGSFSLVCLSTSTFLSQLLLVWGRSERCGSSCGLRLPLIIFLRRHLLTWQCLLVIIFYSLYVKIIRDLLCQHFFVFKLPKWVRWHFTLLLWTCFLLKRVPLLL